MSHPSCKRKIQYLVWVLTPNPRLLQREQINLRNFLEVKNRKRSIILVALMMHDKDHILGIPGQRNDLIWVELRLWEVHTQDSSCISLTGRCFPALESRFFSHDKSKGGWGGDKRGVSGKVLFTHFLSSLFKIAVTLVYNSICVSGVQNYDLTFVYTLHLDHFILFSIF